MRPNLLMDLKYLTVGDGTGAITTSPIACVGFEQALFIITGTNNNLTALTINAYGYDALAGTNKQKIGYWLRTCTDTLPDEQSAWVRYEAGSEAVVDTTAATVVNYMVAIDIAEAQSKLQAAGYTATGIGLITGVAGAMTNSNIVAVLQPTRAKATQEAALLA